MILHPQVEKPPDVTFDTITPDTLRSEKGLLKVEILIVIMILMINMMIPQIREGSPQGPPMIMIMIVMTSMIMILTTQPQLKRH